MGHEGIDQRQAPRFRTRLFGVFRRDIDLDETGTLMLNLSIGGAFVKADDPCPPGSPITLRFYLDAPEAASSPARVSFGNPSPPPARSGGLDAPEVATPLSVAAEVVWWRRPGGEDVEPGMGVRFLQIGSDDQRRLPEYLTRLVEEDLFGA